MFIPRYRTLLPALLLAALAACGSGQTAPVGWLRYAIPPDPPRYHDMPHTVMLLGNGAGQAAPEEELAAEELDRGLGRMVAGTDMLLRRFDPRIDAIVIGTTSALHHAKLGRSLPGWVEKPLPDEGFRIVHLRRGVRQWYVLQGGSPRAELWAAFRFSALVAEDQQLPEDLVESPQFAMRAVELEGDPAALPGMEAPRVRPGFYRLLASVGINALVADAGGAGARNLAAATQPFGIRLWVKVRSGATVQTVASASAPNVAGLAVDVPAHATAEQMREAVHEANAFAKALQHAGKAVLLQGGLGPGLQSNGDKQPMTLQQRAALLREHLEPNVILASDAVSPLTPLAGLASASFGLLPGVVQAAEFDLLPVRSGDLAYPLAAWQSALRTPERAMRGEAPLSDVLRTSAEGVHGGVVGRLSVARAAELMLQPLLQANLYAFGRLAWKPGAGAAGITEEWSRQTWGDDARVHAVATHILLGSAAAYTGNSSPFGLGSLADAGGGPDPPRVAQLHGAGGLPLADGKGVGTGRGTSGTNEISEYPESFAATLADPAKCPEEWLLALHRVPYTFHVREDKTTAQAFYDAHFAGAAEAANAMDAWEGTRALVEQSRYAAVHAALEEAAHQAEIWRESTTEWLESASGVPDTFGFVGRHPGRVPASEMSATGYAVAQTASSGNATVLLCAQKECSSSTTFHGPPNVYRVEVGYLRDLSTATFELLVNGAARGHWSSLGAQPEEVLRTSAAERFIANGIALKPGDKVEVHAIAAGGDRAPLQFLEITRDPRWN